MAPTLGIVADIPTSWTRSSPGEVSGMEKEEEGGKEWEGEW